MAAGSITLILKKDEMTTTTTPMKRKQPIHFMCLSEYFNPEQCFSREPQGRTCPAAHEQWQDAQQDSPGQKSNSYK